MENQTETKQIFPYKPYFKKNFLAFVEHGVWAKLEAKLEKFNYWKPETNEAGETKIIEYWSCSINEPESKQPFNLYKEKGLEVPAEWLAERLRWLSGAPERFAAGCQEAQEFANKKGEPVVIWEYEEGMFHFRELRFTEPTVRITATFYPTAKRKDKAK